MFATKTQIALGQLSTLLGSDAPRHCVLAEAGYGVDTALRQAMSPKPEHRGSRVPDDRAPECRQASRQ
jgi:hypothetical protein